ncbi:MAG TPA: LPXTG cell wall anchor domain-containing protein, partial [Clostridia bacterium]|nr:LPXTG cell wall anchor domain-containing protein [Clostridia bacterium]
YAWFTFRSMVSGGYCYMWFPVDNSTGKLLTGLEIFMETSMYGHFAITRSVADGIAFRQLVTNVVYTSADTTGIYTALKAMYDDTFKKLGFSYEGANYISEKHFEKYFGTIIEKTAKITYPSGTVVVTNPTVEPPQTGDATTVAGFAMIALALVAAAVVTVRKVRA